MSNFAEKMADNPQRLVVMYNSATTEFQWGVVGKTIPVLPMIGAIVRAQNILAEDNWLPEADTIPQGMPFVIVWEVEEKDFSFYAHRDIPRSSLVGMLEVVKSMLVMSRMAQHAGAQRVILGPDGKPMRI